MRICILLLFLSFSFLPDCQGQTNTEKKTIYNKQFKWTITIPAGFDTVNAEKWAKMQSRGEEVVEKTYDVEVENHTNTIFVFQSDQFNYFESNYQVFDTTTDGHYLELFRGVADIVYGTFAQQMKGAKMDTSFSTQTISGLTFQTFKMLITLPNNMVLRWQMFSRLFDKYDLTINIMTVDKQKEKELLDSWLNSKFDK